jgi:fucose permease
MKKQWLTLAFAYIGFIVLGLPSAMVGVATPTIREIFNVSATDVGLVVPISVVGFMLIASNISMVVRRLRDGKRAVLIACVINGIALVMQGFAPQWSIFLIGSALTGVVGIIDAVFNNYVAVHYKAAQLSWLHAAFGLGAALGASLMTVLLRYPQDWYWGFTIVGLLSLLYAAVFGVLLRGWQMPMQAEDEPAAKRDTTTQWWAIAARPTVWLGVALFFVYTASELNMQYWGTTLLYQGQGYAESTANEWVTALIYSFTAGRVLFGIIGNRVNIGMALRVSALGILLSSALIHWNVTWWATLGGVLLLGVALAPIYPLLMAQTPARVGQADSQTVIGWQVSFAAGGAAFLPLLTGIWIDIGGPLVVGWAGLLGAGLLYVLYEALQYTQRADATQAEAAQGAD